MGVTAYISDIHGNTEYLDAVTTILNHLTTSYKTETNIVCAGDLTKSQGNTQEEIIGSKVEQLRTLETILGSYKGKAYTVLGNHDIPEMQKEIPGFQNIEFKTVEIDGKKYYGVSHYMAGSNGSDHKNLKGKLEEVEKGVEKADYVVSHEAPIAKYAYQPSDVNPKLAEIVQKYKKSVICGHVRGDRYAKIWETSQLIKPDGEHIEGAAYFRVVEKGKEKIYRVGNDNILAWAQELNPKGNYQMRRKVETENEVQQRDAMEQRRQLVQFSAQKDPEIKQIYEQLRKNPQDQELQKIIFEKSQKHIPDFIKFAEAQNAQTMQNAA